MVKNHPVDSRQYITEEVAWAYRHLIAAKHSLMDTMARMRGTEKVDELCVCERLSGFVLSASFALERGLEGLIEEDDQEFLEFLATIREETAVMGKPEQIEGS